MAQHKTDQNKTCEYSWDSTWIVGRNKLQTVKYDHSLNFSYVSQIIPQQNSRTSKKRNSVESFHETYCAMYSVQSYVYLSDSGRCFTGYALSK